MLCLGNICCCKNHLTQRKEGAMFVASKHKVVVVKMQLKSTSWMVFVCKKWNTVCIRWFFKMQSNKSYGEVSFQDIKESNIFNWNKNMSSREFFYRYLLSLLVEKYRSSLFCKGVKTKEAAVPFSPYEKQPKQFWVRHRGTFYRHLFWPLQHRGYDYAISAICTSG